MSEVLRLLLLLAEVQSDQGCTAAMLAESAADPVQRATVLIRGSLSKLKLSEQAAHALQTSLAIDSVMHSFIYISLFFKAEMESVSTGSSALVLLINSASRLVSLLMT